MWSFFIKFIRTEGALRRPLTYDDHPIPFISRTDSSTTPRKAQNDYNRPKDDLQFTTMNYDESMCDTKLFA